MRSAPYLAVVALLLQSWMASAPQVLAQSSSSARAATVTGSGLHTVTFTLPAGTIEANVPDDTAVGDDISGTVYAVSVGNSPEQKAANFGDLSGHVIELNGQKIPASEKVIRWSVPPVVPPEGVIVYLLDPRGKRIAQSRIPVDLVHPPDYKREFDLPTVASAGRPATIRGPFNGDSSDTSVQVGEAAAEVLAESPRKVVFRTPPRSLGSTSLNVSEGGATATGPVRVIGLQLTASQTNLEKGQTASLTLRVSGLQGITEPVFLALINRSSSVIDVQGGTIQRFSIDPGQVGKDGSYTLTRTLTGIRPGRFDIHGVASIDPTRQFDLTQTMNRALLEFQRFTGVSITPPAQEAIRKSIFEARGELDDFLKTQQTFGGDPASLTEVLVRQYCSALREARPVARGVGGKTTVRFSTSFQPQPDARSKAEIDISDVKRLGFRQVLLRIFGWLKPNQPVGFLNASSTPDQSPVTIDEDPPKGSTVCKFVLSVGDHNVGIALQGKTCRQTVTVQPFQTGNMTCVR